MTIHMRETGLGCKVAAGASNHYGTEYLIFRLFKTRKEARAFAKEKLWV